MDTNLADTLRQDVAEGLGHVLADTYVLYLKTQNFHWNITGNMFYTLHILFEEQYKELGEATDFIAERIRALGFFAPGSFAEYQKLTSLQEEEGIPDAMEMIAQLLEGHQATISTIRSIMSIAEEGDDPATVDLLTVRTAAHEKAAWMLRSLLD